MTELKISDSAQVELKKIYDEAAPENPETVIRIFLSGFGYDGFEWGMALDEVEENDRVQTIENFNVVIEEGLLEMLGGVEVNYETTEDAEGFRIEAMNPELNAVNFATSGCGGGGCGGCGDHDFDMGCGGGGGGGCGGCTGC